MSSKLKKSFTHQCSIVIQMKLMILSINDVMYFNFCTFFANIHNFFSRFVPKKIWKICFVVFRNTDETYETQHQWRDVLQFLYVMMRWEYRRLRSKYIVEMPSYFSTSLECVCCYLMDLDECHSIPDDLNSSRTYNTVFVALRRKQVKSS